MLLVYLFLEVFQLFMSLGKVLVHFLKCFGCIVLSTRFDCSVLTTTNWCVLTTIGS